MMRALTPIGAAICGLLLTACFDHGTDDTVGFEPTPVAQWGDGPEFDQVPGNQGPVVFNHGGHMGYGLACNDCHHTEEPGGFPSEGCVECHPVPTDDDPAHGGPDDNMLLVGDTQDTAETPGVPFNHYTHASSQGYKLACDSCHHLGGNLACDTCHDEIARQGEELIPKHKRALHLQCKGCHESLVGNNPDSIAPVDCEGCHTTAGLERLDGALTFERASHLSCVTCHQQVKADRPNARTTCAGCHLTGERPPEPEPVVVAEACEGDDCPEVEPVDQAAPASDEPADVLWICPTGDVTFEHSTHTVAGCETCHPEPYPMEQTELGEEDGHAGCAACHPDQVTDACDACHVVAPE